jgi:pimeloyl-ACP methyl ester carboxylesterase
LAGRRLRLVLLLVVITLPLAVSWTMPVAAAVGNVRRPVLLVHGYSGGTCPGYDVNRGFASMIDYLRQGGFSQGLLSVGYYNCDTDMSLSLQTGGEQTDIPHLANRLAWLIADRYSSHGQAVDLVGHSMGGLIVRWMLYRIQAHDPTYPKELLVPEAVALASPFGGAPFAAFCPDTQCQEMAPGSAFLTELNRRAPNPQATGGTSWTVVGSDADTVVSEASALDVAAGRKIDYHSPAYGHDGYLRDAANARDAEVTYWDSASSAGRLDDAAPHALAWVSEVLQGVG